MVNKFFEFESVFYNATKIVSYTPFGACYCRHCFETNYRAYYNKKVEFVGGTKLELKSKEFIVPKYIYENTKVKFLCFTYNKKKKVLNPVWKVLEDENWIEVIKNELGIEEVSDACVANWLAQKTNTEKLYDAVYKRAKILTDSVNEVMSCMED